MKRWTRFLVGSAAVLVGAIATSQSSAAQSAASNKAFYTSRTGASDLFLAPISQPGSSAVVTLFNIPQALKTSNTGGVSAIVSMECALWTYNITTDVVGGGKSSSSSRAALKVWVEIDGQQMEPGQVVYCDRLQATELEVDLSCNLTGCVVTGDVALGLFQKTKNANSFAFFKAGLAPVIHSVRVKAQAYIECRNNGTPITCPTGVVDAYADGSTQAAIGAASILVEEQQNYGKL
jgi:hypothetical protein